MSFPAPAEVSTESTLAFNPVTDTKSTLIVNPVADTESTLIINPVAVTESTPDESTAEYSSIDLQQAVEEVVMEISSVDSSLIEGLDDTTLFTFVSVGLLLTSIY